MRKKKKHGSKANKGHAHGADRRLRERTLAQLIAEARVPERPPSLRPEPEKPPERRVTPPDWFPLIESVPLLAAPVLCPEPAPETVPGTGSGRTMRRSALAMMVLVAAAACVFGVGRKCAAPDRGSEAIDASAIDAGREPAGDEPAALLA
jgi:hypothetical protein